MNARQRAAARASAIVTQVGRIRRLASARPSPFVEEVGVMDGDAVPRK